MSMAESLIVKPLLRGWLHVAAFVIVGLLGMLMLVLTDASPAHRMAIAIYLLGTLTMFGTSALYHRGRWTGRQLRIWRRLDHSTIFLAIAGAYTPIAVAALHGAPRTITLAVSWSGAIVGIALQWVPAAIPRGVFTAVYVVVGWSIIPFFPQLLDGLGALGFFMLIGGGLAYTAGAVVYAVKRPDPWPRVFGYHEVFHLMTIVGAGLHMATVAFVAMPKL